VKCPWSIRHKDPVIAVEEGLLKYVKRLGERYQLIPGDSQGYYEQVQGSMAITNLAKCDFVIWTPTGTLVIEVDFDKDFLGTASEAEISPVFPAVCSHRNTYGTC